ncbi:dicarboxylate/amino acid:cation symporter [Zobellella taiwanensis]|jgi:Na+/H+-dicarboxylate symporter|uniref:Dicarboxylate/amino acid:cation symporter n=1 Tax=Zobellella taiwanensis TaxID=347535 RepID=A0A2P7R705_9GAMM|nr:dicarboxylate/amino acid:cation symporter [Zobellella taiwanensis]PSJ45962.1 dicarboxylate/amino acid:cation symporter [Zobellella taiwanensis]
MSLIIKLIAGILSGLLIGLFAPDVLARLLLTFKMLFGQLISFTIPLLILFFITSGIASLPQKSGKLLGKTIGLAYASTLVAGIVAFLVASTFIPMLASPATQVAAEEGSKLAPFVTLQISPLFGVTSALVAAFVFGIGISALQARALKEVSDQARDVIDLLLAKVIIPLLPVYIAGVFTEMALEGTVFNTLKTFGVVLLLAVLMHWIWLTTLYTLTGLAMGRSPLTLIKNMLPAYFTALGTMSSAATIPVSLRATKANGVREGIANFTVPLTANIHLSGSTITITTCAVAVMYLTEQLAIPSLAEIMPFIIMLGVVMIAAPGAPGGAVMSAIGLLGTMLGFGEGAIALMIALYMAQDSFGTACNVTGDGVIALWVDKFAGEDAALAAAPQAEKA